MHSLGDAHERAGDGDGQRARQPAQLLEARGGQQGKELRDADADDGGEEVAEDQVARLRERRLNGVVLENCGGTERGNYERRRMAAKGWEGAEDIFDDGNADEGAEEGEEVVEEDGAGYGLGGGP